MKTDLTDVTFFILIRLDSIHRLENVFAATDYFCSYFQTNLIVWEAYSYNNSILKSLLNKNVLYKFIEDKDPVLHKTKYYNQILLETQTPFISIWDADSPLQIGSLLKRLFLCCVQGMLILCIHTVGNF